MDPMFRDYFFAIIRLRRHKMIDMRRTLPQVMGIRWTPVEIRSASSEVARHQEWSV
jgi:hypothetical protein